MNLDYRNTTFILSQLASYILAFANIVPTTIGSNKLSILSIINGDLLFDTKLMLISIIFLSLLVLILTGYNLRKKFKNFLGKFKRNLCERIVV